MLRAETGRLRGQRLGGGRGQRLGGERGVARMGGTGKRGRDGNAVGMVMW